MTIREREADLFLEWKERRPGFVSDGVVNESVYLSSKPRVFFILKEVNDERGGGWDLREFVAKGGRKQTWDNVARWVHVLDMLDTIPDWDYYMKLKDSEMKDLRMSQLGKIAVMNIKKSPGSYTANEKQLWNILHEDHDLLWRQYQMYDPELVVCSGTGDMVFWMMNQHGQHCEWKGTKRGIGYFNSNSGVPCISFPHPQARISDNILLYAFADAAREILG